MFTITLLRQGESAGNANGQIQGQSDMPLTEKGYEQIHSIAQSWQASGKHFDLIISSPLLRARATAETIAEALQIPIEYDPMLVERSFGTIEGKVYAEIIQEIPPVDFNHPYLRPGENGESMIDLFTRASIVLQNLLNRPPGSYLLVSHGAFLNMAMYCILGISPHNSPHSPRFVFSNTGYIDLTYATDLKQWRIYRFGNCESNS